MLNFVICDDNINILNKLSTMLEKLFLKHDYDAKISFKTTDVDELLNYVTKNKFNVLVLDINLRSDITGLEIAEKVRSFNRDCYLIFTTAHMEYILSSFKYKTFDFLAKPISIDRLEDTLVRLWNDITATPKKYIKLDNKNTIIDENEIMFIKRNSMKLIIHTKSRDFEIYSSFVKILPDLPDNFIRCHKSYIANVNNISNIVSNTIYFNDNSKCEIGMKYKEEFMEGVEKYGYIK